MDLFSKPKKRSRLRIRCGQIYYSSRKYCQWWFSGKKYSKRYEEKPLKYEVFVHSTPLIRKLMGVDMYLQYNKIDNLKIAVRKIDGIVIGPGEYFSYWKLIGKPSRARGYKDGLALTPEGSFKAEPGGGLCQLSNLIYWSTLHTELTVTERYRHSHDVFPDSNRTQPFGSGATCHYNYLDLEIKNETDALYQLNVWLTEDRLCGEWRSDKKPIYAYEVYEKEHSITPGRFGGYMRNNIISRKTYASSGEEINDEYITENHAFMVYDPYLNSPK